jgi:hypothetical protein
MQIQKSILYIGSGNGREFLRDEALTLEFSSFTQNSKAMENPTRPKIRAQLIVLCPDFNNDWTRNVAACH